MAPAIVNNRICFARFLRCRREVDVSLVVRDTFLGTRIVLPVHLVHWVRWGFATPAKLVQARVINYCSTIITLGTYVLIFSTQSTAQVQ
jgi:hypothetical protein